VEVVLKGYPELAATRDHPEQPVLRELLDLQEVKDFRALAVRPVLRERQGRQESLAQVERRGLPEQPDHQVTKDYPALVVTPDHPVSQVQAEQRGHQEVKACPVQVERLALREQQVPAE